MAQDSGQSFSNDPRVYMAAERTFLAWIRTGLALMGFGFVLARFGLFLRELSASRLNLPVRSSSFSTAAGVALIMIGVIVNLAAAIRHVRLIADLKRGSDSFARPSREAIAVAAILSVVGVAMVIYMSVLS
jgi:putative membrane protein